MSSFGTRLRALRDKRQMTQEDLANALQISKSAVGMYERDERQPDYNLLEKIATYFEVNTDYLIIGRRQSSKPTATPEQTEFLQWVEDNLEESFFYDFADSPEEQKAETMEILKVLWNKERSKRKRDAKE